jgi:DNA polymerase III subunit gamma/tau
MAYQVLARKWRPKRFEEVVGQSHVTRTLQNAIKQDKLAHAYLFTGTRGVGKTSIARLFAKAIRCEQRGPDLNPCQVCVACRDIDSGSSMDYREIDGASNNSVDDVRALIENVQYLPTRGRFKIYVIDEVHMLSVSAFNALLKTLEEPPAHVIFILATTDPQKLLGTVISRCQRYDFKNVSPETLRAHVEHIAQAEKIEFTSPRVAQKLAEMGKGSVRDTLSIFDQVLGLAGGRSISEESLAQALGLAGTSALRDLISAMLLGQSKSCSSTFRQILDENVDLKKLCDQILDACFRIIDNIDNQDRLYQEEVLQAGVLNGITVAELFWIFESLAKDFVWALASLNPDQVVQIILQKICLRRSILSADDLPLDEIPQSPIATAPIMAKAAEMKPRDWSSFLEYLRQSSPTTAVNLEHGNLFQEMFMTDGTLSIKVAFPEEAAVFKEYLDERDAYARLKNHLADFFEVAIDKVNFQTVLISPEEKATKNFKTKLEIEDERLRGQQEEKRNKIVNDPYVKEAEKLFNAKIDKIVLKE